MNPSQLETILASYPHTANMRSIITPQVLHRKNLCNSWGIAEGAHLLDIGCGQGDATLVLATAVGPAGHITGVDTGPPDYGSPYTLAQAQAYILASSLGPRITFLREDPSKTLEQTIDTFDGAVFCHSLWYFANSSSVENLFLSLAKAGVPRVYIAEWDGEAKTAAQEPHSLAAQAQMLLHSLRPAEREHGLHEPNIRGALLPQDILKLASTTGWGVAQQGSIQTPPGMMDGHWEVKFVLSDSFQKSLMSEELPVDARDILVGYCDRVKKSATAIEESHGHVSCMDVMWAVLERES
ncbi:hypothetical protein VPNG_02514 [Cytospora leucostoma]|uniref:Methyltransferase domain-containing protein n=1 Tax=Cytospora leucostoma TaxID=1230097 RepID=A0A423XHU5_9PEZI|nr:hypothetical protein VPNG_02514 [Cytospora leucostoma]